MKFMTQTITQIHMITLPNSSPNSSIFCPSGVFSSSSRASMTARWIFPISVFMPVRTTSALHIPFAIVVPAKSMFTSSERPASTVVQTSGF